MYIRFKWELYEKICEVTGASYGAIGEFVTGENVLSMIDDLLYEISAKEEQIEDLKQDIKENYELKKNDRYEEYGISERNFL